jgi:WD40 repeat protein
MHRIISAIPARASAVVCASLLFGGLVLPLLAVETHFWTQDEFADFQKGNLTGISIRSDGRIFLAPAVKEILDSSVPYLWTVVTDSKGNIYVGGGGPTGSTAKLFRIDPQGHSKVVAEIPGLEIHALAVDSHDRIYAATVPDGKVYRVENGKAEVFFDPHTKYIWAMAFSHTGDLYVATGDRGEIFKVAPNGSGSLFYRTEETHARSMTIDSHDNLIVGTEPDGLILRITPAGKGFVLYESTKREVTAVAIAPDGSIYAAIVGNKSSASSFAPSPVVVTPEPAPTEASPATTTITVTAHSATTTAPPPPSLRSRGTTIAGGSDVYRIFPDGLPRKVWSSSSDIAYTLAFDRDGRPLIGTGNKGLVYRLDNDIDYTLLLNLPPTQVTCFAAGPGGRLYAVTGNIGKVYEIGPGIEKQGTYESDTFDADTFTYWGRLSYDGSLNGGAIHFEARSGNVNRPQKDWSPWTPVPVTGDGGRLAAPPARFVQIRITLDAASDGRSPDIDEVDVAYLPKNVAPVLSQVEITPANYKFTNQSGLITTSPGALTLTPLGQHKHARASSSLLDVTTVQTLQYAKGWLGVRWAADDENGDTMMYKVEIRGEHDTRWILLKDKVKDKYYSWDSTAFPDGKYVVRVTATDAPSNPAGHGLTAVLVSDPFVIDNTPPRITGLAATPSGNGFDVVWQASDALNLIDKAEYSVDGADWLRVDPTTRLSDAQNLDYRLALGHLGPGEHVIAVRVTDDYDNQAVEKVIVK